MLEGERSYQRGQENLVPSNNTSSAPENPVAPKAQENPWYIRHFTKLLIGFGLGGGAVAILLPWMLWLLCGMSSGSSDQLRLHLLYITGGIIAVLTLLQTNWKNQGDRLKIDADIKKNEQDAEKNERDHIRQVHAERRSRYTAAVGQLTDEKAAIRLGGIYTLVGLVDEWLADNTLTKEEQQKEGQVIVNNLCSYIRSPFPLAEKREVLEKDQVPDDYDGTFTADQAQLRGEQDVRRAIFEEMSKRSNKGKEVTVTSGVWSTVRFDFSRAPIFYPLNNLTIEQGNFASTRFYGEANFQNAKFTGNADFKDAKFTGNAHFKDAKFTGFANFRDTEFARNAYFKYAKFTGYANFRDTEFTRNADFSHTNFTGYAHFGRAEFTGNAHFGRAEFTGNAHFGRAEFTGNAYFRGTRFTRGVAFSMAKFASDTSFNGAYFEKYAPIFADNFDSTQFSALVDPQDYLFKVHPESPHSISCGEAELLNRTFILPLGAVLYDPDSWDEETQEYTRISEPAQ